MPATHARSARGGTATSERPTEAGLWEGYRAPGAPGNPVRSGLWWPQGASGV